MQTSGCVPTTGQIISNITFQFKEQNSALIIVKLMIHVDRSEAALFRVHISKLDLIFYNLSDLEEAGD